MGGWEGRWRRAGLGLCRGACRRPVGAVACGSCAFGHGWIKSHGRAPGVRLQASSPQTAQSPLPNPHALTHLQVYARAARWSDALHILECLKQRVCPRVWEGKGGGGRGRGSTTGRAEHLASWMGDVCRGPRIQVLPARLPACPSFPSHLLPPSPAPVLHGTRALPRRRAPTPAPWQPATPPATTRRRWKCMPRCAPPPSNPPPRPTLQVGAYAAAHCLAQCSGGGGAMSRGAANARQQMHCCFSA